MPQDANNIPLDDEDILDLTVVAEPGKQPDAAAPKPDGPPEPGEGGSDFGADLDALLDSLSADGTVTPPAAPAPAAPAEPKAAPIADQTPVAHKVDPNEEMAMPEMADIDSLLAELGADIPATPAAAPEPEPAPVEPVAAEPAAAPLPEFDSILAQAQAAEAQKAAEEAAVAPAPAEPMPEAPAPEPESVPEPVAAVAEPVAAADPTAGADEADSLDLNELDALLDDILATAPEMSAPAQPAAAPAPAPVPEAMPEAPPAMEAEAVPEMPAPEAIPVPDVIPVPDQALIPSSELDPSLAAKIQRLEEAVEVLEEEKNNAITETMIEAMVEAKIAALFAPGSAVMDTIVAATLTALTAQDDGASHAEAFRENLERMAAAAAAKVIREEIAALMNDG